MYIVTYIVTSFHIFSKSPETLELWVKKVYYMFFFVLYLILVKWPLVCFSS